MACVELTRETPRMKEIEEIIERLRRADSFVITISSGDEVYQCVKGDLAKLTDLVKWVKLRLRSLNRQRITSLVVGEFIRASKGGK